MQEIASLSSGESLESETAMDSSNTPIQFADDHSPLNVEANEHGLDRKRKSDRPFKYAKRSHRWLNLSIKAVFQNIKGQEVSVVINLRPGPIDSIYRRMSITPDIGKKLREAMMEASQIFKDQTSTPVDWLEKHMKQWEKMCETLPDDKESRNRFQRNFLKEVARDWDLRMADLVRGKVLL